MDLLLITDGNKSHHVYIKDFKRFMCNKAKNKNKKHFCKYYLQCFSNEKTLIKHKENCLIINGKRSIKLKSGSIKFKNHFKKLATLLKGYADFESLLKGVKSNYKNNASYTEKYQDHIPCSFSYKVVCIDNKFSKKFVLYRRKNAVYRFIEAILKEYYHCKKIIKKHLNKNLVMSAEDEERIQLSNNCWIYNRLLDAVDDKVRDHTTGKYRGSTHWSFNINFKSTKKVPSS